MMRREEMRSIIQEKSGISVSIFFNEVESEILHSPTAFDSDYSWIYQIEIDKNNMKSISKQIEDLISLNEKQRNNLPDPITKSLSVNHLKCCWRKTDKGYLFYPRGEESGEHTVIKIDSKKCIINVDFTHL